MVSITVLDNNLTRNTVTITSSPSIILLIALPWPRLLDLQPDNIPANHESGMIPRFSSSRRYEPARNLTFDDSTEEANGHQL